MRCQHLLVALFCALAAMAASGQNIIVKDVHGRDLAGRSITVVDWDGFVANPAIKLYVRAPATIAFPASAEVSATEPRLYFDLPSSFGASGPSKSLSIPDALTDVPFYLSIFPDRNGTAEDHTLTITIGALTLNVNVHVVDQDLNVAGPFNVMLDYTKDQTTFYTDQAKKNLFQQAIADWTYFIGNMNLDQVAAGAEQTFIWNSSGFINGNWTTNSSPYTGFLLYSYGITSASPPYRSGGAPSLHAFQHTGGGAVTLPLRRSGTVEIETQGNYNQLGWFVTTSESDWWKGTNFGNEVNDLYSIMHHEMGHALFFNPGHTNFVRSGTLSSAAILAYHNNTALSIDAYDHFNGSIDDSSLKGSFGYEYFGSVPRARWLPTKLDLLALSAVGYTLRDLSTFRKVSITGTINAQATAQVPFNASMQAADGVQAYYWTLDSGSLPPGLALDSFTGAISGTPNTPGTYTFTIRVRDSDPHLDTATASASIEVLPAPLAAPANVVAQGTSSTSVSISWSAVSGAATYQVFRSSDGTTYSSVGGTAATSLNDLTAAADSAYFYKVRGVTSGAVPGPDSARDLATTVIFSDDPVVTGTTTVKVAHVTELRRAVNAIRALASLAPASFTDPALVAGNTVKAAHVSQLRTSLDAARSALGLPAQSYSDSLTSGTTPIRGAHFTELRAGSR